MLYYNIFHCTHTYQKIILVSVISRDMTERGARGAVAPSGGISYIEILKEEGKNDQSAHPPRGRKYPSAPSSLLLKGVVSTCLVISAVRKQPMKPVLSHSNRLLSFYHGNVSI